MYGRYIDELQMSDVLVSTKAKEITTPFYKCKFQSVSPSEENYHLSFSFKNINKNFKPNSGNKNHVIAQIRSIP